MYAITHPETLRRWNDFYLSDKRVVPLESYRTGLPFVDDGWITYDRED